MQELNSEQTQFIALLLVAMVVVAFVAGYSVRAALSQSRHRRYGGSAGRQRQFVSAFNTQSDFNSAGPKVSSSPASGVPIETVDPVETGTVGVVPPLNDQRAADRAHLSAH